MEYLVSMTTHVPDGTPEEAVQDIRAREAAHSRELAAQGHLLRLWRPPLQPGEWRTLGLFAAADGDRLEEVLASMPLRVWRTDELTPLSPHPNDPPPAPISGAVTAAEFLVTFTVAVPPGTAGQTVQDTKAREARAAHDLGRPGTPAPAVDPARRAGAGPVPSPRRRPDAGDPARAAAGPLDDRGHHAAVTAPQRPGAHVPAGHGADENAMIDKGPKAAIITGGSQGWFKTGPRQDRHA
jgi:muconolactone delta-isomerase